MAEPLAFTAQHVCQLTGLTMRQLCYWDRRGFFPPQYAEEDRHRPFSRIYSFRDVIGLRTLALLRKKYRVPLQELRKTGKWLMERYTEPWARLTFYVVDKRVCFDEPETGLRKRAGEPSQLVLPIEMEKIAREVRKAADSLRERRAEDIGHIVRNRYLVHNAPVIAGTRIPTSAIWDFHQEGYDTSGIIREYPRLKPEDVAAAIAYEKERRRKRAS